MSASEVPAASAASSAATASSSSSSSSLADIEQAMVEAVAHLEVTAHSDKSPTTDASSSSSTTASSSSSASSPPSQTTVADTVVGEEESVKLSAEEQELAEIMALKGKKVPLAAGHSHMHWMKHVRTLIRRPQQRAYTLEQVAEHADPRRSVWMALRGKVYDVTPYLPYHPGGVPVLMRAAGKDGTKMFDAIHAFVQIESMLAPLQIGTLAQTQ